MYHCFVTLYQVENASYGTSNKLAELLVQTPDETLPISDLCINALIDLNILDKRQVNSTGYESAIRPGPPVNPGVAPDWHATDGTNIWILSSLSKKPLDTKKPTTHHKKAA